MSDQTNGDGGSVRVSLKEMFRDIKEQIEHLGRRIDQRDERYEMRLNSLEHDFAGFESRVKLHEQQPGHADGIARVAALEAIVNKLNTEAQIGDAIAAYIEQSGQRSTETHRWLIGLTVSQLIAILVAVARVLTAGHL